jgi:hypothetical protein
VNAYPVEGRLEKAKDPLFGLAMGEASQISSDSFRFVIKGFYYNLVSDLFCTVAWLSVVNMCLSFYTVGSIHETAYASNIQNMHLLFDAFETKTINFNSFEH